MEGIRKVGTLKTSRVYPGCAKIGNKVIIAGGHYNGRYFRSTEVLDISTRKSSVGGDMATARAYLNLATISSGGGQKLFAVAGRIIAHGRATNTVEEWMEESSTWKEAGSLSRARDHFGLVTLPKGLICPAS